MLNSQAAGRLAREGGWDIWWGANLGSPTRSWSSGGLADVLDEVAAARARAREADGWVMDTYLLRRAVIAG